MNVALFFTYGVSLKQWLDSGLLEREIEIYKRISSDSNIKFTFITYGEEDDKYILNNLKNIQVFPLGSYFKSKNKFYYFVKSFLVPLKIKHKLKNIDLLKTNQLMGSWIPIILKLLIKKPLIIRTGYDILEFSIKENKSLLKKLSYYLLTYFSLFFCDKYFVSSNSDLQNIKNRFKFINKSKLVLRQNWVNIEKPKKSFLNRSKNKILSIGRLEKQKNYINLVQALKNSSLELDIVGDGSLKEEILNKAIECNVNINFLGLFQHKDLLKLTENYKYFILYSKYEGHPKSLIEAMSKGCIPFVLKNDNVEEIIEHKVNGIILNSENDSIIEYIDYLINHEDEAIDISNNSLNLVKSKFSLEKSAAIEEQDYEELV